jgi:hypothetical protein
MRPAHNFRIGMFVVVCANVLLVACHHKVKSTYHYPSGNAVRDYFYKRGFSYPVYTDSLKPICRQEDTTRCFGLYNKQRQKLAQQATTILQQKFIASESVDTNRAWAVFPVMVYAPDSPLILYRVELKEYANISRGGTQSEGTQLLDNGLIEVRTRNIEFEIMPEGTLEYRCDQDL